MHDLARMPRVLLLDRNNRQVMKDTDRRKMHVDDFGQGHTHQRQEKPLGRLAEIGVLHRRPAHDRRWVDGFLR